MLINDLFLVPFVPGGRDSKGYDCFGLFQELCRRRGIPVPEQEMPSFPPEGEVRSAEILSRSHECGWRKVESPVVGCAVALMIGGWVSHLGMMLDDGISFIHTNERVGVAVNRIDDPKWVKRIAGFYIHD